jgi:hypothetical protein
MAGGSKFNLDAFLDGFTGAGLFVKLRLPGTPTCLFDPDEHDAAPNAEPALSVQVHAPASFSGSAAHEPGIQVAGRRG